MLGSNDLNTVNNGNNLIWWSVVSGRRWVFSNSRDLGLHSSYSAFFEWLPTGDDFVIGDTYTDTFLKRLFDFPNIRQSQKSLGISHSHSFYATEDAWTADGQEWRQATWVDIIQGSSSLDYQPAIQTVYRQDGVPLLEIRTLAGHTDYILWVKWSPDASRIATYSLDNMLRIYDFDTAELLMSIPDIEIEIQADGYYTNSIAWSADSRWLVLRQVNQILVVAIDQNEIIATIPAPGNDLPTKTMTTRLQWSADGQRLVIGADGIVSVWERDDSPLP